jgi:hypothetical protein
MIHLFAKGDAAGLAWAQNLSNGMAPLHLAAAFGGGVLVDEVKLLLALPGADANARDKTGGGALHAAARAHHALVAEALLADPRTLASADSPDGQPLAVALRSRGTGVAHDLDRVAAALIAHGANIAAKDADGRGGTAKDVVRARKLQLPLAFAALEACAAGGAGARR